MSRDESLLEKIRGPRRAWIRLLLVALLTVGVFFGLFSFLRVDFRVVLERLRKADPVPLALAALCTAFFPLLSALRFRRMLGALGHDISLRNCFDMIMAAWPLGTVTPSKTGDFVKAYYLKDRIPVPLVLGTVIAERVVDILVLLLLAALGSALYQRWHFVGLASLGFLAGCAGIAVLMRAQALVPAKFRPKVEPLLESLRLLVRSPSLLGSVVLFTVLNWFASIAQLALCFRALGHPVPILFAMGGLPLAIFVGLLPVTLSGMGTRDSALVFLFSAYAPAEVAVGVGLLYSLFGYWLPAVIGLPFLRRVVPR